MPTYYLFRATHTHICIEEAPELAKRQYCLVGILIVLYVGNLTSETHKLANLTCKMMS